MKKTAIVTYLAMFCVAATPAFADGLLVGLEKGDIKLESIGPINFGPGSIRSLETIASTHAASVPDSGTPTGCRRRRSFSIP